MRLNSPEITVIGGGTGSFTLLQDLKDFTTHLNAIVNMSDDGGSTGELRDELGVLPPGDVRQCLAALSDTPQSRRLLSFRFPDSKFANASLGNLILSGLELEFGGFEKAIEVASEIFHITGKVIPVTLDNHELVLTDGDKKVRGENKIGQYKFTTKNVKISLNPKPSINPKARKAIQTSDLIVIAPGNLYCSLLAALATEGMKDAISNSKAKVIYVTNLVNKPGHTDDWHVADYIKELEKYIGEGRIDYVLYNTEEPSKELLSRYAAEGEFPVKNSQERFSEIKAIPVGTPLISKVIAAQDKNDKLIKRTLIRHDGVLVGRELMRIFYE
jgi:uncharacterized cofD-like protein